MTDTQLGVMTGAAFTAVVGVTYAFLRGKRSRIAHYERELTFLQQRQTVPVRPQDEVLHDAAYLVRQHLAGQPTSRRQTPIPERSWQRAIHLCRQAELLDAKGTWRVESYPSAFAALQGACRGATQRKAHPRYVSAYPQDW